MQYTTLSIRYKNNIVGKIQQITPVFNENSISFTAFRVLLHIGAKEDLIDKRELFDVISEDSSFEGVKFTDSIGYSWNTDYYVIVESCVCFAKTFNKKSEE